MNPYEHHMQEDDTFKVYEVKGRRYISPEHIEYLEYIANEGEVTVKEYIPPILPPEPTLEEVKIEQKAKIKSIWESVDERPCPTGIMVGENEDINLEVQYKAYDRDVWAKIPLSVILKSVNNGDLIVIPALIQNENEELIPNPAVPVGNQITEMEYIEASTGTIPPRVFLMIRNLVVTVRDYYNAYHPITIAQVQKAAIAQNLQVESDLQKKWALESVIDAAGTIEEVRAVRWDPLP